MQKKNINYCKNCGNETIENFCSNCGQSTKTKRLNNKHLYKEIPASVFNFEKGVLFTIKSLLFHPINTIKEYLDGKRVKHYKPISLLMLLATINFFISSFINPYDEMLIKNGIDPASVSNTIKWLQKYPSFFQLSIIPFFALAFYFAFKKYKHNFAEHFYIVVFIQIIFLLVFSIPNTILIHYLDFKQFLLFSFTFYLFYPVFYFFFYYDNSSNKITLFLRGILGIILLFIIMIIFSLIIGIIVVAGMFAFKYFSKMF